MGKQKKNKQVSASFRDSFSSESNNFFDSLPFGKSWRWALFALTITFLCFLPSLQNKFVNLDDPQYITENPVVKNFNVENIKAVFSEQFVGNYQPVTMLS